MVNLCFYFNVNTHVALDQAIGISITHFHFLFTVGSRSGANSGSDASPPLQSYPEESSPENIAGTTPPFGVSNGNARRNRNHQSTESDSDHSDDPGGRNKGSSSRKVT